MCVCTFAVNYMLAKVNTWSRLAVNSILVVHVYRIYMNMALYRNSHIKGLIFLSRVYTQLRRNIFDQHTKRQTSWQGGEATLSSLAGRSRWLVSGPEPSESALSPSGRWWSLGEDPRGSWRQKSVPFCVFSECFPAQRVWLDSGDGCLSGRPKPPHHCDS